MCGNAELAEDLVQETFVRATISLQNADGDNAKAWLFQVARNTYLDEWRKAERRRNNPIYQLFLKPKDMHSPYGVPEHELIEKENIYIIQTSLAHLPEKYRTVYILREDENFSYREISKLLNISEENVKVLLYRARKKMEGYLKREDHLL